jgi:hypothetical protein
MQDGRRVPFARAREKAIEPAAALETRRWTKEQRQRGGAIRVEPPVAVPRALAQWQRAVLA